MTDRRGDADRSTSKDIGADAASDGTAEPPLDATGAVQNLLPILSKEKGIMARRRGLIRSAVRTAGRTAVIAGTATAVSGRVANRQRAREALARGQESAPAHAAPGAFHGPAANDTDLVSRLHQLADLKAMGALTDKEFTAAKSRLLQE